MIREYNKYNEALKNKTRLFIPLVTVDLYETTNILINGDPFKKYIKTIEFYSQAEYENFLKANNVSTDKTVS